MTLNRKILLLRHGESTANRDRVLTGRTDPALTQNGRRQVKRAASFIKKRYRPIDALYSSPLIRSFNTALIISKKLKAPVFTDNLLLETNFGKWEGLSRDELSLKPEWNKYKKDPFHFRFPGGESPQDVKKRIQSFKRKLLLKDDWQNIVIVSHYTPIVFYILSVTENENDNSAPFKIENAAVSVVSVTEDYDSIEMLNYKP